MSYELEELKEEPLGVGDIELEERPDGTTVVTLSDSEISSLTNQLEPKKKPKRAKKQPIKECGCIAPSFIAYRMRKQVLTEMVFNRGAGFRVADEDLIEKVFGTWGYALGKQEDFYSTYVKIESAIATNDYFTPDEGLKLLDMLFTIQSVLVKGQTDVVGVNAGRGLFIDIKDRMQKYEDAQRY